MRAPCLARKWGTNVRKEEVAARSRKNRLWSTAPRSRRRGAESQLAKGGGVGFETAGVAGDKDSVANGKGRPIAFCHWRIAIEDDLGLCRARSGSADVGDLALGEPFAAVNVVHTGAVCSENVSRG